ncbi:MAG: alpha/beta hydrolase [Lachnospiraceae bacterium]|nr:alpha/beta hydrolase [Lachnospiraceae bacterium]
MECSGSLEYARFETFIQEPAEELAVKKRPMIIICPGGAYAYTSPREAEPIAYKLMAEGYNVGILYYSCAPAKYPVALTEAASCFRIVRRNASKWKVDKKSVLIMGFSAGGHLAASYACFWNDPKIAQAIGLKGTAEILRPNGQILCYPVISSGKYAHEGSFDNLCGDNKALRRKMSLEKAVSADTPPAFIWHTCLDNTVPAENSLLYVTALREKNIPAELHIFAQGWHGLSLANELSLSRYGAEAYPDTAEWITLCTNWLKSHYPVTVRADLKGKEPWLQKEK